MSLDSQYLILNSQMKLIGVTDINGATPFSNDTITRQIADTDNTTDDVSTGVENFNTNNDPNANSKNWNHTGQITVAEGYPDSYKVAANNYLMYWDESAQHYYVMYISQETDAGTDPSGRHVNTYQLENVLITNMNDYIPLKTTLTDANAETAFTTLFTNSNWKLDFQAKTALLGTIEFDGTTNAMNYLQSLLQTYDVEIDAYAELYSDGNIKNLVVKIVDKLGTNTHHWVADYGNNNMLGITRTTVYSNVVTKLHVLNSNGNSIADVNNGKDYLVNDEANRKYNPNWKNGTYLEGTVTFPTVLNHSALKSLGQRQLDLFSHPRISYEVTPTADFKPGLGDNIRGTDRKMIPELVIDARAISVTTSKADYTQNLVQFGEFVTLHPSTPSYIQNELNQLTNAVTKAQADASTIQIKIDTPDGRDFSNGMQTKRLIMKAIEGKSNITAHIDPKGFIWQRLNQDGSYDKNWQPPEITNDFQIIRQHENLKIAENHAQKVIEFKRYTDFEKAISTGIQFFVPLSNGNYVISSNRLDQGDDTTFYLLDKTGNLQSSMIVTRGGHGSSFGVEENGDGTFDIWTLIREKTGDDSWVARIPWQKNKRVDYQSETVKKYCHHTRYMRVGLSSDSNYVVIGYAAGKGTIYICDINDVKNDKFKPLYQVQQADFGIDTQLTFQSQVLDFPYLFMDYGDYAMKESYRTVYCVNVQTQELVAEHHYSFYPIGMGNFSAVKEPEGMYVANEGGSKYLLQAFNTDKDAFQPIFKMPISVDGEGKLQEANLNGFLLNISSDFSGTYRGMIETDYITEDSEVMIDEQNATQIAQYNHPDSVRFSKGDYAAQYTCQLPDGSYITSHHYQGSLADNHKNDTMYIHWDSNFKYIDNMLVHWGGHGASFGVDTPGQTKLPWIWALVEDFNGDNKYYIAHFKYQGGVSKSWQDMTVGEIEQYCQFDSYIRVNYDFKNKLVGVSHTNGDYDVLDVSDVVNNTYKPLYTINVHDYGFNSDTQTYQSQVLDFPYLYWQSGDYDMHDPRTIYCVNVVTGAIEFSHDYEFKKITAIGTHWEPETINVIKGTDNDYLLVSFNFSIQDGSQHTESFWKIPIEYRQPMDLIEKSIEEVGTQ